jgi:hypothetical protein
LASLVALAFAACGGGGNNPPDNQQDGGTDGIHIQFDGPKPDGSTPPQDGSTGDGPAGGCVASGGIATGGICKASKPCTCPNDCVDPGEATVAGSCWPKPDPTNGCANSTDAAIYFDVQENAHCFPTASITGTWSVPIGTQTNMGGTVSGTITINGVTATLTQGWAQHDATNARWRIYLMPASLSTAPVNYIVVVISDAEYNTTTPVSMDNSNTSYSFLIQENSNSMIFHASNLEGTITMTTADTGATGTSAGSFTGSFKYYSFPVEVCGPNTSPC